MSVQRLEHVGIVVDDLSAATAFFVDLGLKVLGEGPGGSAQMVEGDWVARGGDRQVPANTLGIRRVAFAVDDIDDVVAGLRSRGVELVGEVGRYEDSYAQTRATLVR